MYHVKLKLSTNSLTKTTKGKTIYGHNMALRPQKAGLPKYTMAWAIKSASVEAECFSMPKGESECESVSPPQSILFRF